MDHMVEELGANDDEDDDREKSIEFRSEDGSYGLLLFFFF